MRNREAARYARWSAIMAGVIAMLAVGIYLERDVRQARARREGPRAVPATVQQQSAQFSFSKVEQDRTIFTVRASHATQYKDENRALLEDVWITVYGRDGSRNDNIHTHECSYAPDTGDVRCEGEVQINMRSAAPSSSKSGRLPADQLDVTTKDLSFNRNTGQASTPAAVDFRFPAGSGHGTGASYDSQDGVVRIEQGVEFEMTPSEQAGGMPATASGSSLEIRKNDRVVVLAGPAIIKEGERQVSADTISIELDPTFHAQHIVASGHPQVHAVENHSTIAITADRFEAFLDPAGWIGRIVADGNISGTRQSAVGTDHFSAKRVEFAMIPSRNLVDQMTATGGVMAELHQGTETHVLRTDAMRLKFSAPPALSRSAKTSSGAIEQQHVESAETLAPATIESKGPKDSMTLQAKQFVAQIGPDNRLDKLIGHSGVEVHRTAGNSPMQTVTASEMVARFDAHGDWETVDEIGNVHFQQADRQATAARANIVRPTDTITLDGSPVISDSMSRTTAANITINQISGDLHATGGVISTYIASAQNDAVGLGSGPAHVSADSLAGSVNAGRVTYSGHARLWQGDSVLESEQIEIWRDDKRLKATGHVVAVFAQSSGPLATLPSMPGAKPAKDSSSSKPTLWKISAPALTYLNDQGQAHLEGGVFASSAQGSLKSRTLDAFLGPPATSSSTPSTSAAASGARQLNRVLALGDVVVREGDRRGTAEQADYTAADGKFVLSGGQPTITNASSDTTTGHSLTFFVANDTILVDSQEGSRTVTKHRVEK